MLSEEHVSGASGSGAVHGDPAPMVDDAGAETAETMNMPVDGPAPHGVDGLGHSGDGHGAANEIAMPPASAVPDGGDRIKWTAEETGRFLAAVIAESRKTLLQTPTDGGGRRAGCRSFGMALLVFALVAVTTVHSWSWRDEARMIHRQMEPQFESFQQKMAQLTVDYTAAAAEAARMLAERDAAREEAERQRARADSSESRLAGQAAARLEREREAIHGEERLAAAMRELEVLRGLAQGYDRWQRERDLLLAQLEGMEQEQDALRRQLAVVRALANIQAEAGNGHSAYSPADTEQPHAAAAPLEDSPQDMGETDEPAHSDGDDGDTERDDAGPDG